MTENDFGLKELYDVTLKSTYPIEIDGRTFAAGEVIASFDKIQLSNFNELTSTRMAQGGAGNKPLIIWNTPKEVDFRLVQGVFSKIQFTLMANAHLFKYSPSDTITVSRREAWESDENGVITTKFAVSSPVFVYNATTGQPIPVISYDQNHVIIADHFIDVIVDYIYEYNNGGSVITIGREFTTGYLTLEGKTRIKDDVTGHTVTGIIKIPKLKLMSDLSMQLGSNSTPLIGRLDAVAIPTGVRGEEKIIDVILLNDDIDSDF